MGSSKQVIDLFLGISSTEDDEEPNEDEGRFPSKEKLSVLLLWLTCVLATSPFPEHHTADNIVERVKQVMADHGLEKKHLLSMVHDQCSNMELAGDKLHKETGNCQSYSCAAHRLQLCIEEGVSLTAISQALGAAKKLVTHFRHSALATAELRKRQEAMSVEPKKLQQACITRWNSTLYMIQSLVHNRWPLTAVLADETVTKRHYRYLELSPVHWVILEDLSKVLAHLEVATVFLSEENNVSISGVLPIVHGLIAKLEVKDDDSSCINKFKTKVSIALRRRWQLDYLNPTEIPVLASALDPRFRNLKYLDDELKGVVRIEITRLMKELMESADSVHVAPVQSPCKKKTKTALDILLDEEGDDDSHDDCEVEVSQYFAEKVVPRDTNPLQWWQMNELRFKHLSKVARCASYINSK